MTLEDIAKQLAAAQESAGRTAIGVGEVTAFYANLDQEDLSDTLALIEQALTETTDLERIIAITGIVLKQAAPLLVFA